MRDIWSNDSLSIEEQHNQMKWINEIQHRVTSKIKTERLQTHDWPESDFIEMILHYIKVCPGIKGDVAWSIDSAYEQFK